MQGTYRNLTLAIIRDTANRQRYGGGYKYLVQNDCMGHTAFYTRKAVRRWMQERGLKLGARYGFGTGFHIVGEYRAETLLDQLKFDRMRDSGEYLVTKTLSNGDYVEALIKDGIEYTLNPNVLTRIEFDYATARTEINPYPAILTRAQL